MNVLARTQWPTCPVCNAGPDEACVGTAAPHGERVRRLVDEIERTICNHVTGCAGPRHGVGCPAGFLPGRIVAGGGAR